MIVAIIPITVAMLLVAYELWIGYKADKAKCLTKEDEIKMLLCAVLVGLLSIAGILIPFFMINLD